MMTCSEYMDTVLKYYQSTFDIVRPYELEGTQCLAYGHFYSHNEKYVLTRAAKMWEANSFEHVFFLDCSVPGSELVTRVQELAAAYVEPQMVRGGNSLPEKNHMYTYLTFVFLCEGAVTPEAVRALKKFKLTRNYLFSIRGWCEARAVLIDLENSRVYANGKGKALASFFEKVLKKSQTPAKREGDGSEGENRRNGQ